jgi:hypothetical protein
MPMHMYVALQIDEKIVHLTIDEKTGKLTEEESLHIGNMPMSVSVIDLPTRRSGSRQSGRHRVRDVDPLNDGVLQQAHRLVGLPISFGQIA